MRPEDKYQMFRRDMLRKSERVVYNGTSAHKRPFSALKVLSKNNYVQKITAQIKITGKINMLRQKHW